MNLAMTREDIASAIGVKNEGLKCIIKRGKLKERLYLVGLDLIEIQTIGKKNTYIVSPIQVVLWDELQVYYNIRKKEEHTIYTHARLENGLEKPRAKIIRENELEISSTTAKKFDDILIKENVLKLVTTEEYLHRFNGEKIENVVYKYLDANESVLYIGKTQDMRFRTYEHLTEKKKEDWNKSVYKIQYVKLNSYDDCSIAEPYFISKLKPKYNIDYSNLNIAIQLKELDNLKWEDYDYSIETLSDYKLEKGEEYENFIKKYLSNKPKEK